MNEHAPLSYEQFVLPPNVATRADISRLASEFERVDNQLTTAVVHAKAGSTAIATPTLSRQLTDFLVQNKLDVTKSHDRSELITQLHRLKDKAPVIHMTFATESDPESLAELVKWLRSSIHPQAVIAVGLQPALIAGVYLRTPNQVHDFSLRGLLAGGREVIVKELETLRGRA